MSNYDAIVIGLGGMGSAVAWQLAQRGQRVLGLEQYALGHTRGSSHGQTRIIRQAYFEHPDYVPLLRHAYAGWQHLAAEADTELINLCGLVLAGKDDDAVIAGTRRAAEEHGLPLETVALAESGARFPGLRFEDDATLLHDPLGGYLRVEACVAAHLAGALKRGATLLADTPVLGWRPDGAGVEVTTAQARYRADRLIVCGGAWSGRLLQSLGLPLAVHRMVTAWFPTANPAHRLDQGAPVFACQTAGGFFYGFPELDERGVKIACHEPGAMVADPATVDRVVTEEDLEPLRAFARAWLPGLDLSPNEATVCLYTMTPDGHFIVDRHPEHPQVVFAAGFSGHGFKFCPAMGTILADLATAGRSELPASFLGLGRFA